MITESSVERLKLYLNDIKDRKESQGVIDLTGDYDVKKEKLKVGFKYIGKNADMLFLAVLGLIGFGIHSYTKIQLSKIIK